MTRENTGLRDLVVPEPAMAEALDPRAAKVQAEAFAREAAADPRLAKAVERVGGRLEAATDGNVMPRTGGPAAPRMDRQTAPRVDRSTAPRMIADEPLPEMETAELARVAAPLSGRREGDPTQALAGLEQPAGQEPPATTRRLTVLAAVSLLVGLVLMALIMLRRPEADTRAPGVSAAPSSSPTAARSSSPTAAPSSSPVAAPSAGVEPLPESLPSVRTGPTTAPVEPDPRAPASATGRPRASAPPPKPPVPTPPPSSDRPF